MKKTRVTIALGAHGYCQDRKGTQALSYGFFTKEARLFLEGIERSRCRGAIIFEAYMPIIDSPEKANEHAKVMMDSTLNAGKPTTNLRELWGDFEDDICRMNRAGTRVYCSFERQTAAAARKADAFLSIIEKCPPDGKFWLLPDFFRNLHRAAFEMALERDREIVNLVEYLVEQNPGAAILILRGLAHKPMSCLFDRTRYDVNVKNDPGAALLFPKYVEDAAFQYYSRDAGKVDFVNLGYRTFSYFRNTNLEAVFTGF